MFKIQAVDIEINNFLQLDTSCFMNYKNACIGEEWFQDGFLGW